MSKYKIGQSITITEDFEMKTLGGKSIAVKKGDEAVVLSSGCVKYLTGEAKFKIQKVSDDVTIEGYDYENIAKLILKKLDSDIGVSDILSEYDADKKDILECIEDVLESIL